MSATAVDRPPAAPRLLLAAGLGALVAVALGVYGNVHDPSQELVFTLFFSSTISMKMWLGTAAAALALVQVISAKWVYGKFPGRTPAWAGSVHSLLGCAVYGAFAAKVTIVRSRGLPGIALPVAGGIMFAVLIGAWLTSALWFIDERGWPEL